VARLILPYTSDGPKAQAIVAEWYRYLANDVGKDSLRQFNQKKERTLRELRAARFKQHVGEKQHEYE
jgi:hypothetical protein